MDARMTRRKPQAYFWVAAYLALVLLPVWLMLAAPVPAKAGFWWDAGIALGFSALIMLVMQFFITSRLRKPAAPYGMDVIYFFHRWLAYALLVVALAHPLFLTIANPAIVTEFSLRSLSWAVITGMLALGLMIIIAITSVFRKALHLRYDIWRITHLLLALAAAALAFTHLWSIDYYSAVTPVKQFWLLMAAALILMVLVVRVIRPWLLVRKPWRVSGVREEQGSCWTLTLQPDGHKGLNFIPGQFAWLSLEQSPFVMQEHPFSIASAPRTDGSLQFTIKELGDFTGEIGKTKPGARAYLDGPYGVFSIDRHPEAPGYCFIGGGIGIAPLIGMMQTLADRKDKRPHVLFSAHSSWDRIPRRDEITDFENRLDLTRVVILEKAPEDWQGETGYITAEMLDKYLPDNFRDYQYFICGPLPLLEAARELLIGKGVPETHLHSELFDMA
jgi:predicted ferric reductase